MIPSVRAAFWLILLSAVTSSAQGVFLEPLVAGLNQPVFLTNAHDGSDRKFIMEQPGRILVLQPGASTPTVFLDIRSRVLSGGEQGLLGLAFHPQYSANGRFFVDYTRQPDGATVISEYRVSGADRNIANFDSELVHLVIPQPYANHNGGMIAFGPDNYLYIGMGDGGSANDPENRAQNVNELLGKILRIDVDHPQSPTVPYSSPASNPYSGATPGRDEIFAIGLRNPWRFSFDRLNGVLYAGDVGQDAREEIDIIINGGNYGWRVFEGTLCTGLGPAPCTMPSIPPITEYVTGEFGRCAVTGGYVYRGSRASLPYGRYIFGDFCTGEVFIFQGGTSSLLLDTNLNISSFGEDESGEIYVVDLGGTVWRLAAKAPPPVSERRYVLPGRGGVSLVASGNPQSSMATGYAQITPDTGDVGPDGLEIFSLHQNGVLVSEVSVPASTPVASGRTYALVSSTRNTGIAIANPNPFPVNIDFNFTNTTGFDFGHGTASIPANGQISAYLNQNPFNGGSALEGTFTFRAVGGQVSATAILTLLNDRSELLMSALPIIPINATVLTGTTFSQFTVGGGWETEFIVINPSDVLVTGVITLVTGKGVVLESLNYAVQPRSSQRLSPVTKSPDLITGSARMVQTGGPLPAGVEVLRLVANVSIVTESAIQAIASGVEFRGYAEFSAVARTGLAVANLATDSATATVELRNLDGSLRDRGTLNLPPSGQVALYIDEVPGINLTTPLQGVLNVTSATPIAVAAFRVRLNERGDFLINATPPDDAAVVNPVTKVVFPHLAVGGGFDMQFVLINPQTSVSSSGTLSFFAPNGRPLPLAIP